MVQQAEGHFKPTSILSVNPITFVGRIAQSYFLSGSDAQVPQQQHISTTGEHTIVIQPGSRFLKIGRARDAFPKVVPHVIAKRSSTKNDSEEDCWSLSAEDLKEALVARNKSAKKKQPPNIYASLQTYNKAVEPQRISAHNDSYTFEWTQTQGRDWIVGKEALRINPEEPFTLHWPISRGSIDRAAYTSYREAIGDLHLIWGETIKTVLGIEGPLSAFSAMLVLPAGASRWEIRAYTECLLYGLGFGAVSILLEPVACSFGAGISAGCVVNMGAQSITVACVEEGSMVPESLCVLPYGGDNITRLLAQILQHHSFPYAPKLSEPLDFDLLNDLRESFCTLVEDDLQSMVYEFFVRRPGQTTLNYNFKVIEERLLAVQAMLEPGAPWLVPFEQERHQRTQDKIAAFFTGAYDLELEQARTGGPGKTAEVDVEMVDVEASQMGASQTLLTLDEKDSQMDIDENVKTFECKWEGCSAASFETVADAIIHIKEAHLQASHCGWSNCSCDLAHLSDMSRNGHLIDHFNDAMYASPSAITPGQCSTFTHTEPAPRLIEAKSLEEAIWSSCLGTPATLLPRVFSSILLVGGLSQTPGLQPALHELLANRLADSDLPLNSDGLPAVQSVDFVAIGKDMDPAYFAWKGGAVASKLEATQETWISAKEYASWGAKLLRERLPFIF